MKTLHLPVSARRPATILLMALSLLILGPALAEAGGVTKVKVCHIPPGNPANWHTITVGEPAVPAHLAHGDLLGSCFANCDVLCDDGDACSIDACDPDTEQCLVDHPAVDCDDSLYCTLDSCDSVAGGCVYQPRDCSDGDLCTIDACNDLLDTCESVDKDCGLDGVCDSGTGICVDPCADVMCAPLDQCHVAGICTDGYCDDPIALDGTPCDDGDSATSGDACNAGVCTGTTTPTDPCNPNPCQNGGTCDLVPSEFGDQPVCTCDFPYTGTYCERLSGGGR